jgi:hypothetical protein
MHKTQKVPRSSLEDVVDTQDHLSGLVCRHKHLLLDAEGLSDTQHRHISNLHVAFG